MKVLSRDFTIKEKILLLVLCILLLGLAYYFFIDQPVRSGIASANADYELLSDELSTVQLQLARLEEMRQELDSLADDPSRMPSYNASKEELALLNDILAAASEYTVTFSSVTRQGNQIRRSFTLRYVTANFDTARALLAQLDGGTLRCKLGDVYFSTVNRSGNVENSAVSVSATATFYETMVGGTADAGLPADTAAANTTG